ncbi:hypothetical protein GWK47_006042 [Chionoecetes opilio]|uniref:Uncharacterized protein n=1 Tax=Chionoecetes opilio TaxID=41210 RepID=A0A8J4YDV3_CHIOP|nr:hypothetical protein GWK47_006042 [Chionoecetes opilio]
MEAEMQQDKNNRAVVKRTFTRKCNIFTDTVGQASASPSLTEIYEEVCKSYANVEECHNRYVSLLLKECLISGIPFALHIKNMRIFTIVPTATSAHYGTLYPCLVTTT